MRCRLGVSLPIEDLRSEGLVVFEQEESNDRKDERKEEEASFKVTELDESRVFDFAFALKFQPLGLIIDLIVVNDEVARVSWLVLLLHWSTLQQILI